VVKEPYMQTLEEAKTLISKIENEVHKLQSTLRQANDLWEQEDEKGSELFDQQSDYHYETIQQLLTKLYLLTNVEEFLQDGKSEEDFFGCSIFDFEKSQLCKILDKNAFEIKAFLQDKNTSLQQIYWVMEFD
jgi:ribosome-binding ATPase YchF (GTP1/OBG family)